MCMEKKLLGSKEKVLSGARSQKPVVLKVVSFGLVAFQLQSAIPGTAPVLLVSVNLLALCRMSLCFVW